MYFKLPWLMLAVLDTCNGTPGSVDLYSPSGFLEPATSAGFEVQLVTAMRAVSDYVVATDSSYKYTSAGVYGSPLLHAVIMDCHSTHLQQVLRVIRLRCSTLIKSHNLLTANVMQALQANKAESTRPNTIRSRQCHCTVVLTRTE